jgi:hypothetical protein
MLDDAIQAIRMGDKEEGRRLLEELLETDESNEDVWLWLTTVVDSNEDREVCLENVLALNPNHAIAQRSLNALRAGNFNPTDITRSAITIEEEEEEPAAGATFLDEFRRLDEFDEDETGDENDELVMPSTMAKSKPSKKAAKKKGGFKLNPRLILLAVLVLLIICALGGVAVYNLVGDGEVAPSGGEAGPETPGGGGEVQPTAEPAATDTPAAPPTDTPAPTRPALELPTPKPTDLPTPTATPVVLPTVGSQ